MHCGFISLWADACRLILSSSSNNISVVVVEPGKVWISVQSSCFPRFMLWIVLWITREKKGRTPAFAFPYPSCRFSGHAAPFFGKIGTGDIVSYFHKKIKPPRRCKTLEKPVFAIFATKKGYPHNSQSLFSRAVENPASVTPASYALP